MQLQLLHLEEFRVYRGLDIDLPAPGLRIVGPNGSGKSSILEAIALLSTARSQRAGSDRELIRWGSGIDYGVPPYARCSGGIDSGERATEIAVELEADPSGPTDLPADGGPLLAKGSVRKRCLVDGRPVRVLDIVGRLRTVSFSPEDVAIVSGPPSGRRRLIDVAISQLDRRYLQALARYARVMSQRNGLLKSFARDGVVPATAGARSQLLFWDDELIEAGCIIVSRRRELIARLSTLASGRYAQLAGGARFTARYETNVAKDPETLVDGPGRQSAETGEDVSGEVFREALARRQAEEFRRGVTLVGPHRDDIHLSLDDVDLATFGSRGQQRLGILALKLAEADLMVDVGGDAPVLLLDDVLSELDPERGRLLIETVAQFGSQAVITATDRTWLDVAPLGELPLLQTGTGTVR